MHLHKRTYSLPADALERFEQEVGAGQRSAVIADLLREWVDRQQQERLRNQVIEGCREMAEVYLEIEREYHPLEEEVHHALEVPPPARRRRACPARSRRRV